MSKIILFLTFLGIAHLLPAQNRPFRFALNVGLPLPLFGNPDKSIHLSINPTWALTKNTYFQGEIAYSYMHYPLDPNIFLGHNLGKTFQWDALVGFRCDLVGDRYIIRPYLTALAGYSYVKDEEFRDSKLRIDHINTFQLAGSVNLEIKKHILLTFGGQLAGFMMVFRGGYQF